MIPTSSTIWRFWLRKTWIRCDDLDDEPPSGDGGSGEKSSLHWIETRLDPMRGQMLHGNIFQDTATCLAGSIGDIP